VAQRVSWSEQAEGHVAYRLVDARWLGVVRELPGGDARVCLTPEIAQPGDELAWQKSPSLREGKMYLEFRHDVAVGAGAALLTDAPAPWGPGPPLPVLDA